jgi:hypothetical protein
MSAAELTRDEIYELTHEQFDLWLQDNSPMPAWVMDKCEDAFHIGWHYGREAGRQEAAS